MSSTGLAQTTLTSGVPVSGSGTAGQMIYYQISTSATDSKLVVSMTNLSADLDLYVRGGALPTLTVFDCRPYLGGTSSETCTFDNPGAKTWYILVNAYQAGNYTIKATITGAAQVSMCTPAWNQKLPAAERFVVVLDGDGVLDKETGLVWERSPSQASRTWRTAVEACLGLHWTYPQPGGWHLPSVEQISSLMDEYGDGWGYLPPGHPFDIDCTTGGCVSNGATYWTSSEWFIDWTNPPRETAWIIWFGQKTAGINNELGKTSVGPRAWCVRGGQTYNSW